MRCRQSRRKLNEAFVSGTPIDNDLPLMAHVRVCPDCGLIARTLQSYLSDRAAAAVDDLDGGLALERLRSLVETRTVRVAPQPKELSFMSELIKTVSRRPRFGIGLAAVVAVVLLALVIPLKFQDNTLGYEVAFAGVDRSIALDTERIDELLKKLGVADVSVDIGDCEETCELRVRRLKSADDAYLVYTAFNDFARANLTGNVVMIQQGNGGELRKVSLKASDLAECASIDKEDVRSMLVQCLGSDSTIDKFICVSIDSPGDGSVETYLGGDSLTLQGAQVHFFGTEGGDMTLNEETLRELEAKGYKVQQFTSDSGGQQVVILNVTGDQNQTPLTWQQQGSDESEDPAAKTDANLPQGFELAQNFPNPFNPSTTIAFSLPQAGPVTLEIFNVQGQLVNTLVDRQMDAGHHQVEWSGTDSRGAEVASGVYLYRLTAGDHVATKKMSLVK